MATSRIADSVGRVLGDRYRLTRPLGVGASAHVYVAEDVSLRRRVAIKVLHPALAGDEGLLRRFRAEARVVASLRHPNILTVYDWGEEQGAPYLVMELLEGGSLRSMLDRGALLSPGQAAAVGGDAARALDYAHRRGLVHRDIKPANLIFDEEGRVRVADFGLARALAEATWTEPAGAVVGTARYAAPEQARGHKLDSRADVYSLALVLVEATTGIVPFAADTTLGTLMARLEKPLEVPEAAGVLAPALAAAGTVEPAGRLDAGALANALDRAAAGLPVPVPLPLSSPLTSGAVERDHEAPTEYPGRPKLFDVLELEGNGGGAHPAPAPHAQAQAAQPVLPAQPWSLGQPGSPTQSGGAALEAPAFRKKRRRLLGAVVAVLLLAGGAVAWVSESGVLKPLETVPTLVGDTEALAQQALDPLHLHLAVSDRRYDAIAKAGTVLSQRPATGRLREGQTVSVVLSLGPQPVGVPRLAGLTQSQAVAVLTSYGLRAARITPESSMTVPAGTVISSSPAQGTSLLPGRGVTLAVSTGKPKAAVPAVARDPSFAAARAALRAAGFAATEKDVFSDTIPKGEVVDSVPPGGTKVVVGTTITVEVSKGPDLVAVPNVAGDSVGAATQALEAQGFSVSGVVGNPISTVTRTSPQAGTKLIRGSAVEIYTG